METVDCNLCAVDDSELLFEGQDRLLKGTETFRLTRCRRCGLIYLNPRPNQVEMGEYYPAHYEPYTHDELTSTWYGRLLYRVAIAKRCRIASQSEKPGRLLDIGCGDGDFLLGMRQRGWDVHGLDPSAVAVSLAREKGLEVFQGELLDADYPETSFDLITMWDVLEHLHDPGAQLVQVARLLKPGGRFVVTLPNPHSIDFRVFGSAWTGLDIPRHLYVFRRPALFELFRRAGLEVISARCVTGGQRVSTWSLEWLIDERVQGEKMNSFLKGLIYSQVWYWVWRPLYFLIDLVRLGSSITYTCRRANTIVMTDG